MLIANMVMKNEADRYLPQVLEQLRPQVDEIVITDDASTDNSVAIAKEFTNNVYQLDSSLFSVHEGQLRQSAWRNLSNHASNGDWILAIDADELIYFDRCKYNLEDLFLQRSYHVLGVKFFHMWNETQFRVDKAWRPNIGSRLFRYVSDGVFADKRMACGSEPSYIQKWIRDRKFLVDTEIHIKHMGYVKDEDKHMKYERYKTLDNGDFHALSHIESITDTNPTLVDWESR